jgi:hypothetical protein
MLTTPVRSGKGAEADGEVVGGMGRKGSSW